MLCDYYSFSYAELAERYGFVRSAFIMTFVRRGLVLAVVEQRRGASTH
jgi:hypothetical protein